MENKYTFKRYELKYMLERNQYERVREAMDRHIEPDTFAHSQIMNIYFDTPTKRIIRESIEKPVYKEKLRLRSYGVADEASPVFIELKKKYKSVVYKRRLEMSEQDAMDTLVGGKPMKDDSQIGREIEYFLKVYEDIEPSVVLSYERDSYKGTEDGELRITFDYNILWQTDSLTLREPPHGYHVIPANMVLMEIKVGGGMPLWLTHILTENGIYRTSFSKYGTVYKQMMGMTAAEAV